MVNRFTETDIKVYPKLKEVEEFYLNKLFEVEPMLKKLKIVVKRLNLFLPRETPRFHTDYKDLDKRITCIFYINPAVDLNEGGETQFIINRELECVSSLPGRLVVFDSGILHRATSFLNEARLTLVFSFEKLK